MLPKQASQNAKREFMKSKGKTKVTSIFHRQKRKEIEPPPKNDPELADKIDVAKRMKERFGDALQRLANF